LALTTIVRTAAERRRASVERFTIALGGAVVLAAPCLRVGTPALASGRWAFGPVLAVAVALGLALGLRRFEAGPAARRAGVFLLLAGAFRGVFWRCTRGASVASADLEALAWVQTHTAPMDVVCIGSWTAGMWVPAVAGRAIEPGAGRNCALNAVV